MKLEYVKEKRPSRFHQIMFFFGCWLSGGSIIFLGTWQFFDVIFNRAPTSERVMSVIVWTLSIGVGMWILLAIKRDYIWPENRGSWLDFFFEHTGPAMMTLGGIFAAYLHF